MRAKALYQLLKLKFNPKKHGGLLRLSYREVQAKKWPGLKRLETISRAFKELQHKGWVEVADTGGLFGKVNWYRLTFRYDNYGSNL